MTIQTEDRAGVKLVRLHGELTGGEDQGLIEAVTELLSARQARVVLDLGAVPYSNSAGLGDLVRLVAQANVQEGRIILANLSAYLAGVLEITKLNRFFEIQPTVDAAVDALTR